MNTNKTKQPHVIKLRTPADVIGAIPGMLGFHPTESLVVVCLSGPRNRQGLSMRYDLPRADGELAMAADLAARAANHGADGVILACFTDVEEAGGGAGDWPTALPRESLIAAVLDELGQRRIGYLHALLVWRGCWWAYDADEPGPGTPLPEEPTPAVMEQRALNALYGRTVMADREALAASVAGPVALREIAMSQRLEEAETAYLLEVADNGYVAARTTTIELAYRMRASLLDGDHELADADAARLLVGITDKLARDALFTWGLDDTNAETVLALLSALAQDAVGWYAVPICTVLGGVAYQQGDGALAAVALERALRCDPTYEFARMIDTLLCRQLEPATIREISSGAAADLRSQGILADLPDAA